MKMKFTEIQQEHINVMKHIVHSFIDLPIALKGGTGLLFGYNLDRLSEDYLFDDNDLSEILINLINEKKRLQKLIII
jgi:hypothetical protein